MNHRLTRFQPEENIPPEKKQNDKFAIAGFLLSILWIVLIMMNLMSIFGGVVGGTVGIILSVKGLKSSKPATTVMGLIFSILCIVLSVLCFILKITYKK